MAKVEDKDGQFIEFVTETDATQSIDPGVYYFNVNSVDEQTQQVILSIKKFKWRQGKITNAFGSNIYFAPGIDATTVVLSDLANPNLAIVFSTFGNYLTLLTPVQNISITGTKPNPPGPPITGVLTPNVDYWVIQSKSNVLIQSTVGGHELANLPTTIDANSPIVLTDQDGYQLRFGIDYNFFGNGWIQLSPSTPTGSTITLTANYRTDVTLPFGSMNPENILPITLLPGESLAPGEVFIQTAQGNILNISPTTGGNIMLPTLLATGGFVMFEVRIDTGPAIIATAHKGQLNGALIPGLWIAIGDRVIANDQVAIIVSPQITETYQVYGSKENLSFTLEVKANDLQTASDFTEMLKQELLVWRHTNISADGIEIFEASRDYIGEQRDPSGTAPRYVYSLKVDASADWKIFVPLVTRLVSFTITNTATTLDFPGKLQMVPRVTALGTFGFLPSYA